MTEYDPNLPQEFAHMPKRRGLGAVMIAVALVAAFVLSALFATLQKEPPASSGTPSADLRPPSDAGIPSPQK
jgi:hypothetical protein